MMKGKLVGLDFKLIGVIVAAMVLMMIFIPAGSRVRKNFTARKTLDKKLAEVETKLRLLQGIDKILIDDRVKKMEVVFPSEKPVIELISSLSQLANFHGLGFGGVSLNPGVLEETGVSELRDLSFGFEVEGEFEKISAFMHDLENVAPLMKIDSVSLTIETSPVSLSSRALVKATMEVSAFYQPPPQTLGAITAPVLLLTRQQEALLNRLVGFKTFAPVLPTAQTGKTDLFSLFPVGPPEE